eukprot:CAMPEP_0170168650 /NCGR_PEP_ID=MMETSP0040_2-20121228/1606_1 /TAXON_ID=641309 /ORGANISM="Lotharella oceanica, Strain CCMP622" /LENGTH=236 /DNA_ID=CAMNT_0010406941 /DNA_START=35 /DNA_END=745 /DNA_ORIENTATION=+
MHSTPYATDHHVLCAFSTHKDVDDVGDLFGCCCSSLRSPPGKDSRDEAAPPAAPAAAAAAAAAAATRLFSLFIRASSIDRTRFAVETISGTWWLGSASLTRLGKAMLFFLLLLWPVLIVFLVLALSVPLPSAFRALPCGTRPTLLIIKAFFAPRRNLAADVEVDDEDDDFEGPEDNVRDPRDLAILELPRKLFLDPPLRNRVIASATAAVCLKLGKMLCLIILCTSFSARSKTSQL